MAFITLVILLFLRNLVYAINDKYLTSAVDVFVSDASCSCSPESSEPKNLSFSNLVTHVPKFEFTIKEALHWNSYGEKEYPTIIRDPVEKKISFNRVSFIVTTEVISFESKRDDGQKFDRMGYLEVDNLVLEYSGPTPKNTPWQPNVQMKNCRGRIEKISLGVYINSEKMEEISADIELQLKHNLEQHFCTLFKVEHKAHKINYYLNQFSNVKIGNDITINNNPYSGANVALGVFLVQLVGQAIPDTVNEPKYSESFSQVHPCEYKKGKYQVGIHLTETYFMSILSAVNQYVLEFSKDDFSRSKQNLLRWDHLTKLVEGYQKKEKGVLKFKFSFEEEMMKWKCEKDKCKIDGVGLTEWYYIPNKGVARIAVFEFAASFKAELNLKVKSHSNIPIEQLSKTKSPNFVHLFGQLNKFDVILTNITHDKMDKNDDPFKSGEEEHFSKEKFNAACIKMIFDDLLTLGLNLVYPLHQTNALDENSLLVEGHSGKESHVCIYGNYKEFPKYLFDIVTVEQTYTYYPPEKMV